MKVKTIMTALIVTLSIIIFLIIVFATKISFCFSCFNSDNIGDNKKTVLNAMLKIGFIKIKLFPQTGRRHKKKEKKKKKDIKIIKEKKKEVDKNVDTDKKESKDAMNIKEIIIFAVALTKKLLLKFKKHLKFDFGYIGISVASDDAYKTALMYGGIVQSVSYVKTFFEHNLNAKFKKVYVTSNFTEGKIKVEIDIRVSLRLYQILNIGILFGWNFARKFVLKK